MLLLEVGLAEEDREVDVTGVWSSLGDGENVDVTMLLLEIDLVAEEYMELDVLGDEEDVNLVELVFLLV